MVFSTGEAAWVFYYFNRGGGNVIPSLFFVDGESGQGYFWSS